MVSKNTLKMRKYRAKHGHKVLAWRRERYRSARSAWLEANGPCKHCGSSDNLHVDHIDPATKVRNANEVWSMSAQEQAIELAKCQVLCAPCHHTKTAKEQSRHGRGGYFRGCRCEICRTTHNSYVKEWKRQNRAKKRLDRNSNSP